MPFSFSLIVAVVIATLFSNFQGKALDLLLSQLFKVNNIN